MKEAFELFFRKVWYVVSKVVLLPPNLMRDYGGNRLLSTRIEGTKLVPLPPAAIGDHRTPSH